MHPAKDVRIFHKECISLVNSGYSVSIIAKNNGSEIANNIEIIDFTHIKNRLRRVLLAPWIIFFKALKIKASIYHFHDPELIFVGFLLRILNRKVVYDVHEDVPAQILTKPYLNTLLKKIISVTFKRFENLISRSFSGIITATPYIKNRFIKVNSNTIDIKNYPILEEIKLMDWKNKKDNTICYLGGIFKERGIIENIKSLDESMNLIMAGKISSSHFKNELESFPEWKYVNYKGIVDRKGVEEILKVSKIGLVTLHSFPSYEVSLPIKLFEYMAAGIPIVASNFSMWQEIIESNHCGICVNPHNIEETRKAIRYLLDNETVAKEMGLNGRKLVENKYNWNSEEQSLLEFYSKL